MMKLASPNPSGPHSRSLRLGRASLIGQIYIVTFVTKDRKPWFIDPPCARLMMEVLGKAEKCRTFGFVVMPDHVHWVMQLGEGAELSQVLHFVKSVSAHLLNKYLGRHGTLWQDGFHDHALRKEEDLEGVVRYVVENPVRAGLVDDFREYPYCFALMPV
jgi:REP element-mobilizing transposase RayT